MSSPIRARHVVAVVLGSGLEYYDFLTYSYFAPQIGAAFFPGHDPFLSLMASLGVFGVGFLMRPLGGILFGLMGDRVGRRPALVVSFMVMGAGLALLVLTPPYAVIGIAAPILAVIGRMLQGLALGGEIGPATAYLLEASPPRQRGLMVSWMGACQGVSSFVAGAAGAVAASTLSSAQMGLFGWRLVLGIGLLVLPLGFFLRNNLPETLHLDAPAAAEEGFPGPVEHEPESARQRPVAVILAIGFLLITSGTVTTYLLGFLPTYATEVLKARQSAPLTAVAIASAAGTVIAVISGALSDRIGRVPLFQAGRVLFALTAMPAIAFTIAHPDAGGMILSGVTLVVLASIGGNAPIWIAESLPKKRRSTGYGGVYALAVALMGGATQPLVAWAIHTTHDPMVFGYVLAGASVLGLIAGFLMHETAPAVLERRAAKAAV